MDGFKIVEEGKHHLVLSHPMGHKIKIAKGALSPKKLDDIKKMCSGGMMAEGGDVGSDESNDKYTQVHTSEDSAQEAPDREPAAEPQAQPEQPQININVGQPEQAPQEQAPQRSPLSWLGPHQSIAPTPQAAANTAQNIPPGNPAERAGQAVLSYMKDQGKQYGGGEPEAQAMAAAGQPPSTAGLQNIAPAPGRQPAEGAQVPQGGAPGVPGSIPASQLPQSARLMLAGIDEQQKAQQQLADSQSKIYAEGTAQLKSQQAEAEAHMQHVLADANKISQEIATSEIKPHSIWDGKDTFGKVRTAIGLILGGMGGGILHQENPVLKMLQKQVDDDVDAQKENLSNKNTLLSHYVNEYGNISQAAERMRLTKWAAITGDLDTAAAKAKNPQAKATALQAKGIIYARYIEPAAKRVAAMQLVQSQKGAGDLSSLIPYVVPEKQQAEAFKDADRIKNIDQAQKDIMKSFDQAAGENTVLRTGLIFRTPPSVKAFRSLVMPVIKDNEGRVNETELKTMYDLVPQPGDAQSTVEQKRQALIQFINAKRHSSLLKAHGLEPQAQSSRVLIPASEQKGLVR